MKRLIPGRPSPAMIVAIAAAVFACAGSATAASLISGKQIKNSSITSTDIKNKSLLKADFKPGQLPSGARGQQGPQGPQGLRGPAGANGANGFGVLRYPETVTTFANGESDIAGALCPAGTYPTGGDAWAVDTATNLVDHPEVITAQGLAFTNDVGAGYFADVDNVASGSVDVVVDVVCANASQVLPSKGRHSKKLR